MTPALKTGFMLPSFKKLSCLLTASLVVLQAQAAAPSGQVEYNRDIRPILSENCFSCHGADSASRKAGLRLDKFEEAIAARKDSQPAIVPGKPDGSELVRRIFTTDEDDIMPPAKTHKTLSPAQKDLLKQWIASGAKYQAHWSLIAPVKPELPKVKNRRWVSNPIDNFVLAGLEQQGLKPAPEADRRTLARRVTLDLTGLPPKPEDVETFLKDTSPKAYENLVDRLLNSPHYGEHRARYWLDAARYADTHGIHFDNYREMWSYRDWVIGAFNQNQRFDQFTIDQLAGDLIPNHSLNQQVGSGFNRCNITSNEGGAIDEEYNVLYARDRTEATGQTWMGLTVGCAVCHDHKFDPLSQKEFYSLSAFFNNTTQKAMDGNIKDTPPIITVPLEQDRMKWETLSPRIDAAKKKVDERQTAARNDFDTWFTNATPKMFSSRLPKDKPAFYALLSDNKTQSVNVSIKGEARTITLATNARWQGGIIAGKAYTSDAKTVPVIDNAGDFEKDQSFSYSAWVYLAKGRDGSIVARMDDQHDYRGWDFWLEGGKPGTHIVSKWPEDALKVVANKEITQKKWTHVCVTYDGSAKASGVKIYIDGEQQASVGVQADKLKSSIRTKVPFKIGQRHTTSPLDSAGIQDVRLYERALKPNEVKSLAVDNRMAFLLTRIKKNAKDKEKDELYTGYLKNFDSPYQELSKVLYNVEREGADIKARATIAHVMQEKPEAPAAFILFRGEYDKRRDKVEPATPAALPAMPKDYPRNRLGFAKWLLLPENPLTARVTVNRFWQEVFGTGLVRTTGDFGITGELPSNPELLDWMAIDFRESGWDMKRFFKQVVMSSTYRQSAAVTPDKLAKDPANILLSRGARFRMDGEMVRDYALAASGIMVEKIGGPSVKPYQPEGVWEAVAMIGSNTRDYKQDSGEALYRRSLYTFWKRAAPPASMELFNAPSRETCTVRRERTDTPLQALVTMNDPQFVEAARHLAQQTLKECGNKDDARIDYMAQRLLARPLKSQERKIVSSSLKDLMAHYQAAPKEAQALISVGESKADASLDKPTLAAYTMVANQLLNLDEVLNK
jgi:mono/diheme cytochrome c family protein